MKQNLASLVCFLFKLGIFSFFLGLGIELTVNYMLG